MEGADGIDLSMLKGHKMLNLDSEDEGIFLSSCAGGVSALVTIPVKRVSISTLVNDDKSDNVPGDINKGMKASDDKGYDNNKVIWYRVSVDGLLGGHSGCEIDKGRANANKVIGRVLNELSIEINYGLTELSGGKKDNAIPIQSQALLCIAGDSAEIEELEKRARIVIDNINTELKNEYSRSDPDIQITLDRVDNHDEDKTVAYEDLEVLSDESRKRIITYLMCVPDGIQNMSMSVQGLVETSLNLGIMELKRDHLFIQHSVRSSVATRKEYVIKNLEALTAMLKGKVELKGDYPAWEYREDSEVREKVVVLYEKMYGQKPVVEGIHAGLECGLLAAKIAELDCVAMGPDILDIHTYNERLSISSTKRVYEFLTEFLK